MKQNNKKETKTARIEMRISPEEKAALQQAADKNELGLSEYILKTLHESDSPKPSIKLSHQDKINAYVILNRVTNIVNTYPALPTHVKKELIKELNTYVRY